MKPLSHYFFFDEMKPNVYLFDKMYAYQGSKRKVIYMADSKNEIINLII